MDDPVIHVYCQEPSTSSKYPPSWPPLPDTILIEISTQNFQGTFLGVKKHHSWCQEEPCPPCLWSGTLTLLIEISTRNFQGIFLGVKKHYSWRQEQPCPPCVRSGTLNVLQVPPFLTPPSWHTYNWDINTNFSGYLPYGKKHHSWHQEWPCPPCLRSGTLTVLQVPVFLTRHSWHISNNYINKKMLGYLP